MARITIGMPVYNGAATIERAIAGLEAQTFGDFVVVASDNASTDSTPEVLAAWAARDHRVTVHHQAENLGTVGNFNYLITVAETDYFMWHACDDQMSPDYLERLCAVLDGDAGCGLAVGDIVKRDADGTEKRRVFPDLAGLSRLARVMTLLKRPRAPWIYGLFRSGELRAAYGRAVAFGFAWGADYVTLLPFILDDRIRGDNAATFHYRMTASAKSPHRPGGGLAHMRFFGRYLRYNLAAFADSRLGFVEKLLCLPFLLRHIARAIK
jgi:glycosyltransferase involved in cell wall biosynthesis